MDWSWVSSVAAFAFATSMTPGPNNAMLTASGANYGFRATLPHMAGIALGFPFMLLVMGTVGSAVMQQPMVHLVLKIVGTLYLLWLAWKIARADPAPPGGAARDRKGAGRPLTFLQAAAFQWVNAKAWMIGASALAAYAIVSPTIPPILSVLAIVGIMGTATVASVLVWTSVGMGAARFLTTRRAMRRFNLGMAALLVVSLAASLV